MLKTRCRGARAAGFRPATQVAMASILPIATAAASLAGQDLIKLVEVREVCRDCITFDTVAVLGGDYESDNLLSASAYVTRWPSGRTFAADLGAGDPRILVYTSDGRLESVFGRAGEGPGEYWNPMPIVELPGGRVAVFDDRNARLSILEADGTFLNSAHFPHDIQLVHPLSDSILLANGTVRTPERIGIPFHLVHIDGTILRSFGPEASLLPGAEEPGYRYISIIDERRFLSTAMSGRPYRIELWDGRSVRTVWTRATEWFPEEGPPGGSREIRPRVAGLHRDGSRLWTIVTVPDPAYTPAPPGTRVVVDSQYRDSRWDTVVELIDLSLGEVVASQRFDQHILRLLWDGTALRLGTDDLGVPLWQILALRIRTPQEL